MHEATRRHVVYAVMSFVFIYQSDASLSTLRKILGTVVWLHKLRAFSTQALIWLDRDICMRSNCYYPAAQSSAVSPEALFSELNIRLTFTHLDTLYIAPSLIRSLL